MPHSHQQNVFAMVGFGVSYKCLSSVNVWSNGTNMFFKPHLRKAAKRWVASIDRPKA